MKNGLYVGTSAEYIERYSQNSADLSLIGKGGPCEVMIYTIKKDSNAYLEQGDLPESMEFFYVLEGIVEIKMNGDENQQLNQGDYFYVHHLKDTVHFLAKEDVKLLYLSSDPVFSDLSNDIKELGLIMSEVESKDIYTHGHSDRVKDYSLMIAEQINLSKERTENLIWAALFHDIGKVDIPDEILLKTGKLTNEEYGIMKKHSEYGIKYVEKTYYKKISKIIRQHHERLDGTGYPDGLMEDEIVLEAKIIAIADTYDAMTTDRPYRKALTKEHAIKELKKYSGLHYDYALVKAFIKAIKNEK